MSIYDFFLSRNNAASTPSNYIGHKGRLFYNDATGEIRLSDGTTPGGLPIPITVATSSTFGGIKLGPGTELNGQGQIVIDPTGLDFAFGDFYAFTNTGTNDGACLSSINPNQDVNLVSNGLGTINVIGEFNVHKTNNSVDDALGTQPIFSVKSDGQVTVLVPVADVASGAVEIIGGTNGTYVPPQQPGVMLHVTGIYSTTSVASRIYNDGQNNLAAYVGRRYNGNASSPTAVKAGDVIMRISAVGYGATSMPAFGSSRIAFVAEENYTDTANGGRLEFYTNPIGGNTLTPVATMTNALGVWATKFTGPLIGNADTATKLATARNINGVSFDGTANINIANTQTLTIGSGLAGGSYNGSSAATVSLNTATLMTTAVSAQQAPAGTLSGTTLATNVVHSSLTSIASATNILAGQFTMDPANVVKNTASVQTATIVGLTTSHKILALPASPLGYGIGISAAWPSATNTLSIEFQNASNSDVNLGNINIDYFAWI